MYEIILPPPFLLTRRFLFRSPRSMYISTFMYVGNIFYFLLVLCLGLRTCALRTTPSVQPRARSPPAGPRVSLPLFTLFYYFYRRGRVVTWSATRHVTRSRWRMSSSSFACLSLSVFWCRFIVNMRFDLFSRTTFASIVRLSLRLSLR